MLRFALGLCALVAASASALVDDDNVARKLQSLDVDMLTSKARRRRRAGPSRRLIARESFVRAAPSPSSVSAEYLALARRHRGSAPLDRFGARTGAEAVRVQPAASGAPTPERDGFSSIRAGRFPAGKWTSPELSGNLKVIQDTKKWWGRT